MPQKVWSPKRERQYEHISDSRLRIQTLQDAGRECGLPSWSRRISEPGR
jgi:hypothetical protein